MNAYTLVAMPLIFGLVGFVTPCSLGINTVFLAYIKGKDRDTRIRQAVAFSLSRGLFLAAVGMLFGLLGQRVVGFLALLGQTFLVGRVAEGAVALYLFGIGMSLPLLLLSASDRANELAMAWGRRSRRSLYYIGGGLLIAVGLATFSASVMAVVTSAFGAALQVLGDSWTESLWRQ